MKVKAVPSAWIQAESRRLDVGPFLFGAVEARERIRRLAAPKAALRDLTAGPEGGIFKGPMFSRRWVTDPDHGVPFLGSSSMLLADLSHLPLLSRRLAHSPRLRHLEVQPGMTLISRSGTIGRMVYARPDMAGIWASQDVMKVCPDPARIPPGYLYAFLSSRFGVPMVVGGTYGAIIQHIEPEHIAGLPVPRLGNEIEARSQVVIAESARRIDQFGQLCREATGRLFAACGTSDSSNETWHQDHRRLGWAQPNTGSESFRAINYEPRASDIRREIENRSHSPLGSLCDPRQFKGKIIFKRIDADEAFGIRLVGQREAFQLRPDGRWIARKSINGLGLQLPKGATLIPSHGTLGEFELYCRAIYVTERQQQLAYSGDFFRCVALADRIPPGYLFAFMRSRAAFRLLRSISAGGKQQEQHPAMMWRFPIPRLDREEEEEIGAMIDEAALMLDLAMDLEDEARRMIESAIEGAAP